MQVAPGRPPRWLRYQAAIDSGATPGLAAIELWHSELAREVGEEMPEGQHDDAFYTESAALFYVVSALQLEHGVVQPDVRRQTLLMADASAACSPPSSTAHSREENDNEAGGRRDEAAHTWATWFSKPRATAARPRALPRAGSMRSTRRLTRWAIRKIYVGALLSALSNLH